ncbi:Peroxisomal protein 2 [Psilocybe cubensis]|nr:Peroxisomal protein 2 [Psilocybe cubensis]KAH9484059.1 Peroxisomal protein 2 [Psilocybe cubensis]
MTAGVRSGDVSESPVFQNPWYIVATVVFSASNQPEGVKYVLENVLEDLGHYHEQEDLEKQSKKLAQKMREAIFKSGMISGYSKVFLIDVNSLALQRMILVVKAINSLQVLNTAIPDEWKVTEIQRDTSISLAEYEAKGMSTFRSIYGETADSVDGLLTTIYPDLGWFSRTIAYGITYGHGETLSQLETSYTLVAALIASDTPQQIGWHLDGAKRGGATTEEVKAIRQISMEVAKFSGIKWKHGVPEVT